MAKDNANGNSNPPGPAIHLILQGKGGVGKSVVASWLAEFLIKRGQNVQCIDGDPVNRSLWQYKALRAEKLDLVNSDGLVQRTRYDALLERFASEEAVFILDSGATAFLPFWTFVVETRMIDVVRGAGRQIYIHVPISGGEMTSPNTWIASTLRATADARCTGLTIPTITELMGPVDMNSSSSATTNAG